MSLSNLESLPNEILIDTLEKYVNGVDILVALADQLNNSFDLLLAQCQQLRFDFIRCPKTDFRLCIGLLPTFIDKIVELSLSERDTPGRIHAFLSFFPSFVPFKRLRKLNFHFNGDGAPWSQVEEALDSLSKTPIDSLSIKARNYIFLHDIISAIRGLTTLKRLSLAFDYLPIYRSHLTSVASNVEYLNITGLDCEWENLQSILRCASRLKYLNVLLTVNSSYGLYDDRRQVAKKIEVTTMSTLHTLILYFGEDDPTTFDMLARCVRAMPILRRLEITAHSALVNASAWELLLEKSLPLLAHFRLQTNKSCLKEVELESVLTSFQTSFWMAKKNFNIIINAYGELGSINVMRDHVRGRGRCRFDMNDGSTVDVPAFGWWTTPQRVAHDDIHTMDSITSMRLSSMSSLTSEHHHFGNVKYLVLDHLDRTLIEWTTTHVNCSRITEIAILRKDENAIDLTSLFACTPNISSLRISFAQLMAHQHLRIGRKDRLRYLDISDNQHPFTEESILAIAKLFRYIEHLVINTRSLSNVPMRNTHLPYLRSLTFKIVDSNFKRFNGFYQGKEWEHQLRQETNFLFQREANWITVWIDEDALNEPYWQTVGTTSSRLFKPSKKRKYISDSDLSD